MRSPCSCLPLSALAAAALPLLLSACEMEPRLRPASPAPQAQQAPQAPAPPAASIAPPFKWAPAGTWVYDCGRDFLFTVLADGPARVRVILPDKEVILTRADAASGERYEAAGYVFWSRGDQCRLQTPEAIYAGCDSDVERAIWEDARRRGIDFRAWGSNPSWLLEICEGRSITIDLGPGSVRHRFPAADPAPGPSGEFVYRTLMGGHGLVVTIMPRPCLDQGRGRESPAAVVAVLDGRTYRGCGSPRP